MRHNQKLELKMTNNIKVKTITMNNNENINDWEENESYIYIIRRIKWNIGFQHFNCTYLWWNCWEIWRTGLLNSLLCPFECPYLWHNYQTNWRTNIINISELTLRNGCHRLNELKRIFALILIFYCIFGKIWPIWICNKSKCWKQYWWSYEGKK